MSSHRKVVNGSAVTATTRVAISTYKIPKTLGGVLTGLEVIPSTSVFTTAQTVGGKVDIVNDSIDYIPFEFYTNSIVNLTSTSTGGSNVKAFFLKVHKKLPGGSVLTAYYAPSDAGSQLLEITYIWESGMGFNRARETFFQADTGTEITQASIDTDHIDIEIPEAKGGRVFMLGWVVHGTLETVLCSGGLIAFKANGANPSWEPLEYGTSQASMIGAGSVEVDVETKGVNLHLPGGVHVIADYTPVDNQSQRLGLFVGWHR